VTKALVGNSFDFQAVKDILDSHEPCNFINLNKSGHSADFHLQEIIEVAQKEVKPLEFFFLSGRNNWLYEPDYRRNKTIWTHPWTQN
jgi:hypothetical protein